MTYTPSQEQGPNGPRDDKEQLEQIDRRTAEFEGREYEEKVEDPFSPEHAPAFTLITLMRIYDVQMALLTATHPEIAHRLNDLHESGQVLGSFPWLNPDAPASQNDPQA